MKIHLENGSKQTSNFMDKKNSGFVDSGFVKTCDELVIGICYVLHQCVLTFLVPCLFGAKQPVNFGTI